MTIAKTVQVSDDNGSTWHTLPGSSGELNNEAGSIDDTVFGQSYQSSEAGLIGWNISASAYYKGFAGYMAKIKKQGTSTVMTNEAATQVGASKTYKINTQSKEIFNPAVAVVVKDGGVDKTAEIESINYLFGEVTFKSSYTVGGAVTITGEYYPTTTLGNAQSYTLTQTAETIDTSDFATVQGNGGYRTYQVGLKTVSLEMSGFYNVTAALRAALQARSVLIVEIDPHGDGKSVARGFFKAVTEGQSGDVGALEEETVEFNLQVPDSDYLPFDWQHRSNTILHESIQICLDSWIQNTPIDVRYLYDGTNGVSGEAVVTEMSLSGGLDDMNEFSVNLQGSGATTAVGTG